MNFDAYVLSKQKKKSTITSGQSKKSTTDSSAPSSKVKSFDQYVAEQKGLTLNNPVLNQFKNKETKVENNVAKVQTEWEKEQSEWQAKIDKYNAEHPEQQNLYSLTPEQAVAPTIDQTVAPEGGYTPENLSQYKERAKYLADKEDWTEEEQAEAKQIISASKSGIFGNNAFIQEQMAKDNGTEYINEWSPIFARLQNRNQNALIAMVGNLYNSIAGPVQKVANRVIKDTTGYESPYDDIETIAQYGQEQHPIASTVGNIAGEVAKMAAISKVISPAIEGIKAPAAIKRIITGGAIRGLGSVYTNAGEVAEGNQTIGQAAANVGVNTLAGAGASGVATGVGTAGRAVLERMGLAKNVLANTLLAGLSGSSYQVGSDAFTQLARELGYKDGQSLTTEQLLKDAAVGGAFASIDYLLKTATNWTSKGPTDTREASAKKWFSDVPDDAAELKKAYRNLAKQYHPDNGGDAAIFAEIEEAYRYRMENLVQSASAAYTKAQTEPTPENKADFEEKANTLILALEELSPTTETNEAIEIINSAINESVSGADTNAITPPVAETTQIEESNAPETEAKPITAIEFAAELNGVSAEDITEPEAEMPTPEPAWAKTPETGKEYSATLYHGEGKDKSEIYNTTQYPILGEGKYYALSEGDAAKYGDNISSENVTLKNPLVIRDDSDWKTLINKAGWQYANPFGLSDDENIANIQKLKDVVLGEGHDGIIVQYSKDIDGDMNSATGGWIKTLDNVFGHDQVVVYDTSEQATATPQAFETRQAENVTPEAETTSETPTTTQLTPIEDRAKQFPADVAKVYLDNYIPGTDIVTYDTMMKAAYNAGKQAIPYKDIENQEEFAKFLSANYEAVDAIYRLGYKEAVQNMSDFEQKLFYSVGNSIVENGITYTIFNGGADRNAYRTEIYNGDKNKEFVEDAHKVIYRGGPFTSMIQAVKDLNAVATRNELLAPTSNNSSTNKAGKSRVTDENTPLEQRKNNLINYIKRVLSGADTKRFEIVDPNISGILSKEISDAVGFNVEGYEVRLSRDEVKHVDKRHGGSGKADSKFADPDKLGFLVDISNLDGKVTLAADFNSKYKNSDGTFSKKIIIEVEQADGTYQIIEAVPNNKDNAIYVISAYRTKKAVSKVPNVQSLEPTSKNGLSHAADDNVPQNVTDINGVQAEVEEADNGNESTDRKVPGVERVLPTSGTSSANGRVLDGVQAENVPGNEEAEHAPTDTSEEGRGVSGNDAGTDRGTRTPAKRSTGVSKRGNLQPGTGSGRGNVAESTEETGKENAAGGRLRNNDENEAGLSGLQREGTNGTDSVAEIPATASEPISDLPESSVVEIEQNQADSVSPKGTNFVIPESGLKLPTGEKARYKANVNAIKILRAVMSEGRFATAEEQEALAKYVGWGGIPNAFDKNKSDWAKEYKELKELLTDSEWNAAYQSTMNAHYTDISVIHAMYNGLRGLGFAGGRILEPSSGVGHFIGAMPADLTAKVKSWTAVELDEITGNIAKALYPNANVFVQGYETVNLPDNYMDLIISNVPFGNYAIRDKSYPSTVTGSIHNYFFAKSLDKVHPGGIVCFITSRYTMDSRDSSVREYIMKRADLLGAIRLPDTAFKGNAGTEVVTDIIVLKKRAENTPYAGEPFKDSNYNLRDIDAWDTTNDYFAKHPEMVLGTAEKSGTMYSRNSLTYKALPGKLDKQIEKAFGKIKGKMEYPAVETQADIQAAVRKANKSASGKAKNGNYVKSEGKIYKNKDGQLEEVELSKKEAEILNSSITLRDTARELLTLQQQNGNEADIAKLRKELNAAYDEFVKKNGPLHKQANKKVISDDTDFPFILSLENYDKKTGKATKADIFSVNTVTPNTIVDHVDNVIDGAAASINETGGIDLDLVARLMGVAKAQAEKELIDSGLAFKQKDESLQPAQMYLSGNVRAKLKEAKALAGIDPVYNANVEALEKVVPKDIAPEEISVQPGATWIPPQTYADFAAEILGGSNGGYYKVVEVTYSPLTGNYKVEFGKNGLYYKTSAANISEYGTQDKSFMQIFEAALNSKDLKVYYPHDKDEKPVLNRNATIAVKEKKNKIKEKFQQWMWSDESRRKEFAPLYNDLFNCNAVPQYDGSTLRIDGLSANITLREHQANAVQRIIMSGGNTLLAHGTGAGKTLEMASACMKLRQIGAIKKPMITVPKNLLGQWEREFHSYYPAAKVLIPGENDFSPKNRKVFANKIATGDYDAVIVTYEQFEKIPLSDEATKAYYQSMIDDIIAAEEEAKQQRSGKSFSVKQLAKKRAELENKIAELNDVSRDKDNIEFESLGIDSLFVDEAHNFKNLFYTTQMQGVADLGDKKGSKRASDLYMKVRYLQKLNGGKGLVFGTATPVMNSVVEMYTMQRYLQGDLLEQKGLNTFDAWANEFGEVVEVAKMKSDGNGYEMKASMSRYRNLGELQQMFRSMADVVTQAPGLKLPKLKTGGPIVVECEPSEAQEEFLKEIGERATAIKGGKVNPKEDNILKVYSDGKKMSYSQRMIDANLPYEGGGKIPQCIDNVLKEYKASDAIKGTQLIFCDRGVPGGKDEEAGMFLYQDIKNLLVKGGIPEEEIAYAQNYTTDAQKEQMQEQVNEGKIRVLIGSTQAMGTGLNIQKRAVAMHEINAPDRPGDIEQNRGRIVRQKNMNAEVSIYTYITKRTFDSRQWDNLKRKGAFIHQAIAGDFNGRTADGDGDFSASAAEIAAIASDNPLIIEQNELSTKLVELEALASSHNKEVTQANRELARLPIEMKRVEGNISDTKADIAKRVDTSGDNFKAVINGKEYTKRSEAGAAIIEESKKYNDVLAEANSKKIGTMAGLDLYIDNKNGGSLRGAGTYTFKVNLDSSEGTVRGIENTAKSLDELLKGYETVLEKDQKDIKKYEGIASSPFDKAKELAESRARMDEIMSVLNPKDEVGVDEGGDVDEMRISTETDNAKAGGYPDMPDNWKADRVGDTDKQPMSLTEIVNKISSEYGVNITAGHVRGNGKLGQFNRLDKGIRTRFFNDLPTITHELGHSVDTKYSITDDKKIPKEVLSELKAAFKEFVSRDGGTYPEKAYKREGMAEFMRQYLQDKAKTESKYPKLTKHVLSSLDPKDLALFDSLADEINAYYALGGETATDSIRLREEGPYDFRSPLGKIKDASARMYQAWVDSLASIKEFDKAIGSNVYMRATNTAYSDAMSGRILESNLTDMNGQYVGPGLIDAMKGVNTKDERTYKLFGEYLTMIHGQEVNAQGMQVLADDRKDNAEWMKKRQEVIEKQHPEFIEAAKKVIEFTDNFTYTWMVQTGLVSEKQYKAMKEKYPNYVPFYRVMEKGNTRFGSKRGFANQNSPVMRMKGSGRDIYHPVDNIIDMVVRTVNTATRNSVMQEMRYWALKEGADASFMERIPEPLVPHFFHMEGIKQNLADTIAENVGGMGLVDTVGMNAIDKAIADMQDVLIQFERGKAGGDVVTVIVNGEKEYWKVNDPQLLESLTSMTAPKVNGVLAAFGAITRMMTANITGNNAIWSLFSNAPRDLETLMVYSKYKNPLKLLAGVGSTYVNAVKEATGKGTVDPLYYEYLAMGGGHASAYSADVDLTKHVRAKFNPSKIQRFLDKVNPLHWVSFLTDTIEMGPRFATYKLFRQAGYNQQQSFYQAMDVTVNFRRSGANARNLGKMIPFFNAQMQGLDKFVRHFTADDVAPKDRAKTATKRVGMYLAVSAILGALFYYLNNRTDDDKEEYQKLSTYTKNSYWVIPSGEQGKFITIPKARELSVLTSFVTAALEKTEGENEHAFDDFYQYATDNFLPSIASEIAQYPVVAAKEGTHTANTETLFGILGEFGAIGVGVNIGANRDFLGRPIVSSSLEDAKPKDQYTESTSKVAKFLGDTLNWSPQLIDYVGNQMLGYIWQTHQALWPVGDSRRDVTLGVKNKYLKDNLYSTDIVNWLYDERDKTALYDETDTYTKQIEKKTDNNMTTFYGRFNKLNKEVSDEETKRNNRRLVVDMISEYRKEKENGSHTKAEQAVYDYAEKNKDLSILPSVMDITIKDDEKKEYTLTDKQYYEYQTLYNGYYWSYIEDTYNPNASASEQAYTLKYAKELAATNAKNDMLRSLGAKVTEKYNNVSSTDLITYQTGKKKAGEDGTTTKDEVIDVILDMIKAGTSDKTAKELYKTEYDSDELIDDWKGSTKQYLQYTEKMPTLKSKDATDTENHLEVMDYIQSQDLSEESKKILWELAGYKADGKEDGEEVEGLNFDKWYEKWFDEY